VRRVRSAVLLLAALLLLVGVVGWAWTAEDPPATASADRREPATTADRPRTTTTTAPTTTTTAPPEATPSDQLARGSSGPPVEALQRRLTELRLDPGPVDGRFGGGTFAAVLAFQKLAGLEANGVVGPQTTVALEAPPPVAPLVPGGEPDRVEVDLGRQLLLLWEGGRLRLATHVSTGNGERYCEGGRCGIATTPTGAFRFSWRWPGWRESRLGKLYNPVYFTSSGIAIHGSTSVPTYPASHGCVRIPMHIAEYFPDLVDSGDAVYVVEGPGSVPAAAPVAPSGPPPADPPTAPEPAPPEPAPPPAAPTTTTVPPPSSTTTTTAAPAPPAPPEPAAPPPPP
jgi:peptidoglycan hydrolase-like protein with peptidoglycan-binding domain